MNSNNGFSILLRFSAIACCLSAAERHNFSSLVCCGNQASPSQPTQKKKPNKVIILIQAPSERLYCRSIVSFYQRCRLLRTVLTAEAPAAGVARKTSHLGLWQELLARSETYTRILQRVFGWLSMENRACPPVLERSW